MRKSNLLFTAVALMLAASWFVSLAPRKMVPGLMPAPAAVRSFTSITYGPACDPEGGAVTLYGDGRIELPAGVIKTRLTAAQEAQLTAAVNETGYFSLEELSVNDVMGGPVNEGKGGRDPRAGCFFRVRDAADPDKPHKPGIPVTTAPSTFTSVTAGGRTRQVRYYDGIHYKGCPAPAARVAAFEKTVSGIIRSLPPPHGLKGCF